MNLLWNNSFVIKLEMITYNTASNSPSPVAATSEVGTDHPSVSLSLPLVQLAVQQHILRGEFFGFNTLLLEVMFCCKHYLSTNVNCPTVQLARIDISYTQPANTLCVCLVEL